MGKLSHAWNLSPTEAVKLQRELAASVRCEDDLGPVRTIAGVDVSMNRFSPLGFAAIVLSLPRATGRASAEVTLTLGGWGEVLADRTLRRFVLTMLLLLTFGYAQMESGFAAYVVEVASLPAWVLGPAFAANTAAIVAGQMVALRLIQGRRRSRVLATCALVWAAAWTLVAVGGLLPTAAAALCAKPGPPVQA